MHDKGVDCILVTAAGRLVGIFTDRDAVVKVAGQNVGSRSIATLMTRDPVVLRHDETIAVAINKLAVGGFRHIPIVENGRPTGVVTARDVFHHLAEMLD
jgi:CBS domain-containing protein